MKMTFTLSVFFLVFNTSCSYDKASFVDYFSEPENGLVKSVQTDRWNYKLQYRNAELMCLIELDDETIDKKIFEETLDQYRGSDYFVLSVAPLRAQYINEAFKTSVLTKLSFNFAQNITLRANEIDHKPKLYHFENNIKTAGHFRILLAFDHNKFRDREITISQFDSDQNIAFLFEGSAVRNIPDLKL